MTNNTHAAADYTTDPRAVEFVELLLRVPVADRPHVVMRARRIWQAAKAQEAAQAGHSPGA